MRRCYPLAHLLALCALLHRLILGGDFIAEAGPTLALDLLPSSSGSGAPLVEVADQLGEGGVIPGDRLKTLDRLKETRKLRRVRQKVNHAERLPTQNPRPYSVLPGQHHIIHTIVNPEHPYQISTLPDPVEQVRAPQLSRKRKLLDFDLNFSPPPSPTHEVNIPPPVKHTSYNNSPHDVHTRSDPDDFWDMREPIPPGFIPMPSITRWSVVHPDLFIRYHSPFKARIDSFSNKYTLRMSVRRNEKMKNLPVYMVRCLDPSSETPRRLILPKIAQLRKSPANDGKVNPNKRAKKDRLQVPFTLGLLFGNLIKSILFSHGAFLKKIDCTVEEELSRHDALMSWLNELVFSNENRLPICGQITETDFERLKDQGYNSAQKRLITYLQGQPEDAIFYTDLMTLALIGIWYKRELPHEWAERFLSSEKVFWLRMQEAIGEARQDRDWRAGQWIEKMYKGQPGDTTLGNFDLIELRRALQSKSNRRRPWSERRPWVVHKDNFKPSVVEREIIMAHQKVNKLVNTPPVGRAMSYVAGIQAALQYAIEKSTGKEVFLVRVVSPNGRTHPDGSLVTQLTNLLCGLRQYHQRLLNYLEHEEIPTIPNAHSKFLDWLSETILRPPEADQHFPLFGYLSKEIGDQKSLDHTIFNPIQHIVLLSLTKRRKKDHAASDLVSILGYWYKVIKPNYWNTHFKNEFNFGQFVVLSMIPYGKETLTQFVTSSVPIRSQLSKKPLSAEAQNARDRLRTRKKIKKN
ncbi:hypothetical protein MJO29_010709 [Puccinia striiformis f. sp. tritici]|nr:hypothetical protein MJO29_010709 [Puccinia striiformis f. sp. tritici]